MRQADAFGTELPDVALLAGGHRIQAREHLLPIAPQAAALVACLVGRAKGMESANAEGRSPGIAGLWLFSTRAGGAATAPGKRTTDISAHRSV